MGWLKKCKKNAFPFFFGDRSLSRSAPYFKINDVQGKFLARTILLNIDLLKNNLKMFDASQETCMAMWASGKVDLHQECFLAVRFRIKSVQRAEPKSYTKLKATITHKLADRQKEAPISNSERLRKKYRAIPVVHSKTGDGRQWTSKGSCSRGAKCACKHDDQKQRQWTQGYIKANIGSAKTWKSAMRQEQAAQDETTDLFVTVTRKRVSSKTNTAICWHPRGRRRAAVNCSFLHFQKRLWYARLR